jgi:hypothetical protein
MPVIGPAARSDCADRHEPRWLLRRPVHRRQHGVCRIRSAHVGRLAPMVGPLWSARSSPRLEHLLDLNGADIRHCQPEVTAGVSTGAEGQVRLPR